VHKHGADKYGKLNWRKDKIKYSTYKAAILRHTQAFFDAVENNDPDSGISHLAHIRACCAVLRDAELHGTAIDDRAEVESLDNNWREGTVWAKDKRKPTAPEENVHEYMRELHLKDD